MTTPKDVEDILFLFFEHLKLLCPENPHVKQVIFEVEFEFTGFL